MTEKDDGKNEIRKESITTLSVCALAVLTIVTTGNLEFSQKH
jgi:hypothetical protein